MDAVGVAWYDMIAPFSLLFPHPSLSRARRSDEHLRIQGQQRFAPLNSWPDNGNLDKARRLL